MIIATHNGVFHADELVAIALLTRVFPMSTIIRSRDPKVLATADILVDVGGGYERRKVLDHHFKGAEAVDGVTLSSAGLVARDFPEAFPSADVAAIVVRDLIRAIDAGDNGQSNPVAAPGVNHFTFAHALSAFNPAFGEDGDFDAAFGRALGFAKLVVDRAIVQAEGEVAAAAVARDALASTSNPAVVVLDSFAPVMDYLVDNAPEVLFLVYPGAGGDGTWMVQCVPPARGSFGQRLPLPAGLAGLRDQALAEATGVPDAVFVHPGRFIGGAKSKAGALALVDVALS